MQPTITSPGRCGDRVHPDRQPEVVRQEERRERDHDQVVEEERPAGEEAREVVERDAVKVAAPPVSPIAVVPSAYDRRHDEEEQADDRQHHRREPERVQRDDPEREVERGGDLAVRDGGERRRVEHALEPRQLARH